MDTLSEIVNFAIPRFKERMDQGVVLYEDIAYHISIEPIGITPLYKDEGYLLLFINNTKTVYVHQYKITVFEQANESYRAIRTELLEEMQWSLVNTFEHIKRDLIKRNRHLPNPAAYLALSQSHYPLQETLLPITKRVAGAAHRAGCVGVRRDVTPYATDRHVRASINWPYRG